MGTIHVRRNGPQPGSTLQRPGTAAEAPRWMSRLLTWDPLQELAPFVTEERLTFEPAFDVKETKDSYLFRADVPGTKASDIDISLRGKRLTIEGKREDEKEEKGDTVYTYERSYGSFTRSFTLPDDVNDAAVHADLRDGVLSVIIPKKAETTAKKIPVESESGRKKA